jgi:hypothetical protein
MLWRLLFLGGGAMRVISIFVMVGVVTGCGSDVGTVGDAGNADGSSTGDASGEDASRGDASSEGGGDSGGGGDGGAGGNCDPKNDLCQRPLKCCPGGAAQTYTCQTTNNVGMCIPKP